jgi:membrane peptidoglycan carboxypeptidase
VIRVVGAIGKLLVGTVAAGLVLAGFCLPWVGSVAVGAKAAVDRFRSLPHDLAVPPVPQRSRILAADGSVLASFYSQNRRSVALSEVAPIMQKALIDTEDVRFFDHGAIDVKAALRAAVVDVRGGSTAQGGSTITQQYVKNVLVQSGDATATADTFSRKLQEARYAIAVEKRFSKREILERYLNLVYFGEGAYGIQAGAHRYFGVDAAQLTLPQAALLAGLVQSPTAYDPVAHPRAAQARRALVLRRMAAAGDISLRRAADLAKVSIKLKVTKRPNECAGSIAPFYCDWVRSELLADPRLGESRAARDRKLLTGGITVQTALDLKVQHAAQHAVSKVLPRKNRAAAAIAVVQPGTGKILAMASNRGYGSNAKQHQTRLNLVAGGSTGFQAGSTFKMFTLAAAIERHVPLSFTDQAPPSLDIKSGFTACDGAPLQEWKVHNAGAGEAGRYSLVGATWESVNTFYARLEKRIGVCRPWQLARDMGIRDVATGRPIPQVPSFTLGVGETSPLQVAAAYATLAARGVYCQPQAMLAVLTRDGRPVTQRHPHCERVLRRRTADVVTSVLRGVIDGPDPARTGAGASIGRPAAGKTGTTDSEAAAWFSGYTPQLAASVWVGDPRGAAAHPLLHLNVNGRYYDRVYGGDLPADVWRTAMRAALAGVPRKNFPGAGARVAADAPKPLRHH